MKLIIKFAALSLLLMLAGGASLTVRAEEKPQTPATPTTTPTPTTPKKPAQQQLTGKVIAVDKATKTITIQVSNQSYALRVAENTKFTKGSKQQTLNDVLVGDEVTVTVALQETPGGRVEVVVVSVELPETTAAQGTRATPFTRPPPFQNGPNPGNVDGPIISPNR